MDRKQTLGGSEIAAVAGLDPYRSPIDIFLEKMGEAPPREETWPMKLGTEQEAVIADWYRDVQKVPVERYPRVLHPDHAWVSGSPDRVMLHKGTVTRILECKFRSERMMEKYGEPGTDQMLPGEIAQIAWYLMLFPAAEACDLAVQFGNQERRIYTLNRDPELIEMFFDIGRQFWKNHVLTGIPPELDGSESSTNYLKRKYPFNVGAILEPTDPIILDMIDDYQKTRRALKQTEDYATLLENQLKDFVGDAEGLRGPWGKILWRKNKDGKKTDWEALAKGFNPTPDQIAQFTKPQQGARPWKPYFKKEEK